MSAAPTEESPPTTRRDVAAATEYMATAALEAELYLVVNDRGGSYLVDLKAGACTCPDHRYRGDRLGADGCKHLRRVTLELGERPLPPIPRSRIDPLLLRNRRER